MLVIATRPRRCILQLPKCTRSSTAHVLQRLHAGAVHAGGSDQQPGVRGRSVQGLAYRDCARLVVPDPQLPGWKLAVLRSTTFYAV